MLAIPLDVSLRQSKIKDENLIGGFVETSAEVVGLDISMNEMTIVDILDAGDHLIDQHKDSLQGKLAESLIEK